MRPFVALLTLVVALLTLVVVLAPAASHAATNTHECKRMSRQIAHFEGVIEMAEDRHDQLWEAQTRRHVGRLSARRDRICPEYAARLAAHRRAIEQTKKLMALAAKVAIRYFTFGAY